MQQPPRDVCRPAAVLTLTLRPPFSGQETPRRFAHRCSEPKEPVMNQLVSDALNLHRAAISTDGLTSTSISPAGSGGKQMPDVAQDAIAATEGTLERVGMSEIEVVLRVRDESNQPLLVPGRANAFISLDDPKTKGIHMSRLFLSLHEVLDNEDLTVGAVNRLLQRFVDSHQSISRSSYLQLSYDQMLKRPALLSDHAGWRCYPIRLEGELADGKVRNRLHVRITYSSTCPCSAALSRQLIQEAFQRDFQGQDSVSVEALNEWLGTQEAILAVPHSQRSFADVSVELCNASGSLPLVELIDRIELALATPVQAAVKRIDEQEFARLNGANLMFCEDAARRMKASLESMPGICDYRVLARHLESLHPHDAVAIVTKGVPGGLRP